MRRGALLVFVLAAVMDLGDPLVPEPPEAFEQFDEAAHDRRRVPGPERGISPGPAARAPATTLVLRRSTPREPPARRRSVPHAPRRKIPLSSSELASSPDAH